MDNVFISVMTDKDLLDYKAKYSTNPILVKLVDDTLAERKLALETKRVEEKFTSKLLTLAKLPAPPESIHNVYLAWKQVEVPQEIPDGASEAKIAELKATPIKTWQWVTEVNKGFTSGKSTDGSKQVSKRAITVNKRDGQTLKFVGNFQSGSKACEHLKLSTNGDSAMRVLSREGYIVDAYNGTDYTA
jgi:hypothetical protein